MKTLLVKLIFLSGAAHIDIQHLKQYYLDGEINLRIIKIEERADPYPTLNTVNQAERKFWKLRRKFHSSDRIVTHVFINPLFDTNGLLYLKGYATNGCFRRHRNSFSMSVSSDYNQNGISRLEHSVVVAANDIGHQCGASSLNDFPNLMHQSALEFVEYEHLSFAPGSIYQMNKCLGRKPIK